MNSRESQDPVTMMRDVKIPAASCSGFRIFDECSCYYREVLMLELRIIVHSFKLYE
jgi:hypothetical protein